MFNKNQNTMRTATEITKRIEEINFTTDLLRSSKAYKMRDTEMIERIVALQSERYTLEDELDRLQIS